MKTVYKYLFDPFDTPIELPEGAEILHVAEQHGDVCMWALVNPENDHVVRKFEIYGTGHTIDEERQKSFIGTVFYKEFVFHIFEVF